MNYQIIYDQLIDHARNRNIDNLIYVEQHHIIPKHANGSDDDANLVYLTFREHILAHRLLWKIFSKKQDFVAYRLMSGIKDDITRKAYNSLGGESTVVKNRQLKLGPFFDSTIRYQISVMGGKVQGKKNAENKGFLSKISKKSKRMTGKFHITNGIETKVVTSLDKIPDGWYRGRTIQKSFGKIGITNGTQNKRINADSEIPEGWKKGWTTNIPTKIWITDGLKNFLIDEKLQIPDTFWRGMTRGIAKTT